MKQKSTDLNLFKVLVSIYQQRNLTRAAEALSVTQPAVSNALNRLRTNFNDQLFLRTHQGMSPTPFTESIIERVQEGLQLLNSSVASNVKFDPENSKRQFRISMNDLFESIFLPKLIQVSQSIAPNISFDCHEAPRAEIERELSKGSLDLALGATLPTPGLQLEKQALKAGKLVCVVRKDHPTIGETLSLQEYLDLKHIAISSRRKGLGHEDLALKRLGHRRQIALRIAHYRVAPLVVQQTDLALTMYKNMAEQFDLNILPLPFKIPPLDLNVYWHKSTQDDPAQIWLRDTILNLTKDV